MSADVHLLGIGGAGMSGIARVLRGHGRAVSGCDRSPAAVDALSAEGIDVAAWATIRRTCAPAWR